MKIATLIHLYQPYNQQEDVLSRIINESYRPLMLGLKENPKVKLTVNITGALTELLVKKGFADVVTDLAMLAARKQIELTGSAMYHTILPLLPKYEINRQITINNTINKRYLGEVFSPSGFFSPELAINALVLREAVSQGFVWIAAPELSYGATLPSTTVLHKDEKTGLFVFFRNKRVSSLILSAAVRDAQQLWQETNDIHKSNYWFVVMDAETFGHHRIGHEKLLFEILTSPNFEPITISELLKEMTATAKVENVILRPCTWTNQEQDFWVSSNKTYILWKDPTNLIHKFQWQLANLAMKSVNAPEYKNPSKQTYSWRKARKQLDIALASDQFWWASAKPWWSLEMIESGAYALKQVLVTLDASVAAAETLYRNIIDKAFYWQRSGYVRRKHLATSGTYLKAPFKERAPAEWFNQVVLEFEFEMNAAVAKQDFERAIKWRDALLKIKQGTDIYDVLHVVDELWLGRNVTWATPLVKPFLQHEWEEFSDFAKSCFRDVKSKEEFERWKGR